MKIITIIITYNGMKWIEECLQSLRKSSIPSTVLVIDNMSNDGTADYIRAHFPEVVLMQQHENLGFGQANNVGLRYAISEQADYVLLLNQDAYVAPDMIEQLLTQADGVSLLSPIHLNGDGTELDYNFKHNTLLRAENKLIDDLLLHTSSGKYEVDYVNAACWFLPVDTICRIGGFNPLFKQYSEDDNYVRRLHYHHIPLFVVPQAEVRHDRKRVGNSAIFYKGKIKRELFVEACNINHTFGQRLWTYLKCLNDHRYRPMDCLLAILWLPFQKQKISYSRKVEKKSAPNWL